MELLQLKYFFDSARSESFAKTAEKYMVPPSSVSASIKRLEQELGCQLFDRQSNRIVLNTNGEKFQRSVGIIFDELDQAKEDLSDNTDTSQDVEIKLLVKSIRSRVVNTIIEYKKKHPHIRFTAVFDFADTNFDEYDLIIAPQNESYDGWEKFELYNVRLRLQVSSDHPLYGRSLTMRQLRNYPFVIMSQHAPTHKILLKACKNAGFTPKISMEVNDGHCIGLCIRKGMGIGVVRERDLNANEGLSYLSVSDFEEREIYYGYYKRKPKNDYVESFIQFLRFKIS
ncbi:MAG: LysR family transcriptional regulator [Clostridia bacterium]|nr:LysR family transcriptional regulator [Clostridia bacterium]